MVQTLLLCDATLLSEKSSSSSLFCIFQRKGFCMDDCVLKKRTCKALEHLVQLSGAVEVSTPHLLPRYDLLSLDQSQRDKFPQFIDSDGMVITLPHALMVGFVVASPAAADVLVLITQINGI